jgi:transcription initiation factor TFIIIB Brf1 subunit/transcription initiation factor TFIIB
MIMDHICTDHIVRDNITGEYICTKCGIVIAEDNVVYQQRIIDNDDYNNIYAEPPKFYLGSPVTIGSVDSTNNRINNTKLSIIDSRIKQKQYKHEYEAMELFNICRELSFNEAEKQEAVNIYLKLRNNSELMRGRGLREFKIAVVYYICKKYNIPYTLDNLVTRYSVNRRSVYKAYSILCGILGNNPPSSAESYIISLCNKLSLSYDIKLKALSLYGMIKDKIFLSHISIATAIIAYVLKHGNDDNSNSNNNSKGRSKEIKISEDYIAEVAGITVVTVRNVRRRIENMLSDNKH